MALIPTVLETQIFMAAQTAMKNAIVKMATATSADEVALGFGNDMKQIGTMIDTYIKTANVITVCGAGAGSGNLL